MKRIYQRGDYDCLVATLATIHGLDYESAFQVKRTLPWRTGDIGWWTDRVLPEKRCFVHYDFYDFIDGSNHTVMKFYPKHAGLRWKPPCEDKPWLAGIWEPNDQIHAVVMFNEKIAHNPLRNTRRNFSGDIPNRVIFTAHWEER